MKNLNKLITIIFLAVLCACSKLNRKIELIALGDYIPPEEPETSTPVGQFTWTEWKQKADGEDYSASDYTPNAKILDSLKQVIDLNSSVAKSKSKKTFPKKFGKVRKKC